VHASSRIHVVRNLNTIILLVVKVVSVAKFPRRGIRRVREQFAPRVRADDKHRVVDVRVVHHLERVIPLASFRRRRRQLASSPHLAALLSSRPSHDAFDFSKITTTQKREKSARTPKKNIEEEQ
tara:strand:- start:5812 stop:6183 length:372 start_codon:yes stop_codon:yes gene_type:complete